MFVLGVRFQRDVGTEDSTTDLTLELFSLAFCFRGCTEDA